MIWDILQENTFDSYFSNQSLQIQTLLLDQNIITQLKNLNPNLINQQTFFNKSIEKNKQKVILKLIQYTTILPQMNQGQNRIHKLPYVSSEVLAIDNSLIYNEFIKPEKLQEPTYFSKLVQILKTDSINNQILLGYFEKVMNNLYNCNKIELAKLVFRNKQIFLTHLDKPAVGTIIKNCIVLLDCQQGIILAQRKQMQENLIEKLITGSQQQKTVSSLVLVQIIQKFQTFSSGDQLLQVILKSTRLLQIFQLQESNAIDLFLTGYFHKALQKIFSLDNNFKSILQISKEHLQKSFLYLKRKKHILFENIQNNKKEGKQFLNQSRKIVKKIDQRIIILLNLIKLAMENKLSGLFSQPDIQNLWNLLESHPLNDIIKVPIFKIFSLFLQQSSQSSQKTIFLSNYHEKSIKLFELSKEMFGQHLFNLFKLISKKENVVIKNQLKQKWQILEQYFKKCTQLSQDIQKTINRYSNRTKVIKLVVDQQDNNQNQSRSNSQQQQNSKIQNFDSELQKQKSQIQQSQKIKQKISEFTFNQFPFQIKSKQSIQQKQMRQLTIEKSISKITKNSDPFADFSFFEEKIKQEKPKSDKKNVDFSNFSDFI